MYGTQLSISTHQVQISSNGSLMPFLSPSGCGDRQGTLCRRVPPLVRKEPRTVFPSSGRPTPSIGIFRPVAYFFFAHSRLPFSPREAWTLRIITRPTKQRKHKINIPAKNLTGLGISGFPAHVLAQRQCGRVGPYRAQRFADRDGAGARNGANLPTLHKG